MKESTFEAKVQALRRVAIPKGVAAALGIEPGDKVDVTIRKKEVKA